MAHQLKVLKLLRDSTKERQLTSIVVLHDLNAAYRFADCIVLMRSGCVLAGWPPAEVLTIERLRDANQVVSGTSIRT